MTTHHKYRLSFLAALCLLASVIVAPTFFKGDLPGWWPGRPIKLGLDLRGGSYFVLHVKTAEAVKGHLVTLASSLKSELRKEKVGVLRARQEGERGIEVQLLTQEGAEQVDAYLRRLEPGLMRVSSEDSGEGGKKLHYELNQKRANDIKKESVEQSIEVVRRRIDQYGVAEPTIQRSGEERILVQLPDVTDLSTVRDTIGKLAKLEFRMVAEGGSSAGTVEKRRKTGGMLRVEDQARLTGREIKSARIEIDPQSREIAVSLEFNATGSEIFDRITSENVGKRFAIILDDLVYSDPVIRERISQGRAQISGGFTKEEAHQLAVVLRSGALPAPLEVGEQRIIGASLGADSIKSGVYAALIGALLVVCFMILYYKKSGVQAVACTAVNMLVLLASLSLFGATLTLPGIGGLALTIGMAVDSNIIIFERIREELRSGTGVKAAIEDGFRKAYRTILDSNSTHLLAGLVLYSFGTGPVRGFAVTLCLGVLTTLFGALFVSRLAFDTVTMTDKDGKLSI